MTDFLRVLWNYSDIWSFTVDSITPSCPRMHRLGLVLRRKVDIFSNVDKYLVLSHHLCIFFEMLGLRAAPYTHIDISEWTHQPCFYSGFGIFTKFKIRLCWFAEKVKDPSLAGEKLSGESSGWLKTTRTTKKECRKMEWKYCKSNLCIDFCIDT